MAKRLEIEEIRPDANLPANTLELRLVDVESTRRVEERLMVPSDAIAEDVLHEWLIELTDKLPALHVGNAFMSKDLWDGFAQRVKDHTMLLRQRSMKNLPPALGGKSLVHSAAVRQLKKSFERAFAK